MLEHRNLNVGSLVADMESNPAFSCIPERGRDLPGPPQLTHELGLEHRGLFFSQGPTFLLCSQ